MIRSSNKQTQHDEENWFVLRTTPRGDSAAVSELVNAGYHAFSASAPIQKIGSKCKETSPLFPGYIFLKCNINAHKKPSLEIAPHASQWVNFGGDIFPVPDSSISDLQDQVATLHNSGGIWHEYQAGDEVMVTLNDSTIPGKILETVKSPDSKVRVSLQFINNIVLAEAPYDKIYPKLERQSHPPRRTRGKRRWIKQSTRID